MSDITSLLTSDFEQLQLQQLDSTRLNGLMNFKHAVGKS